MEHWNSSRNIRYFRNFLVILEKLNKRHSKFASVIKWMNWVAMLLQEGMTAILFEFMDPSAIYYFFLTKLGSSLFACHALSLRVMGVIYQAVRSTPWWLTPCTLTSEMVLIGFYKYSYHENMFERKDFEAIKMSFLILFFETKTMIWYLPFSLNRCMKRLYLFPRIKDTY